MTAWIGASDVALDGSIAKANLKPIEIDRVRCDLCGTCVGMCQPDSISIDHALIHVDLDTCTMCMKCVGVCPVFAISGGKE